MRNKDIVRIERTNAQDDEFSLSWQVTSLCNYACDFCIQGNRVAHKIAAAGESAEIRRQVCLKIKALLESLGGEYSRAKVALIGGEVTILKDFPALLKELASNTFPGDVQFQITTNLSLPAANYTELYDIVERYSNRRARRTLHVSASYYKAYVSQQEFCKKVVAVAKRWSEGLGRAHTTDLFGRVMSKIRGPKSSLKVGVPLLSDDDYLSLIEMREALGPHGVQAGGIIIREYETDISAHIMEELMKTPRKDVRVLDASGNVTMFENIQALGASLEDVNRFNPKGYLCDAGNQTIHVNTFGQVERCPVIGGNMHLGSILDDTFHLLSKPGICTADHCSCNMYRLIEKPNTS